MEELYPNSKFPPQEYLEQVCESTSKASFLYIQLWKKANADRQLSVPFDEIRTSFQTSKQAFNFQLMLLGKTGKVSSKPDKNGIHIELTNWDYDENLLTP